MVVHWRDFLAHRHETTRSADVHSLHAIHTEFMSSLDTLSGLSDQLIELVTRGSVGVAAVKGAAYRTSSAVALDEDLLATAEHTLKRNERIKVVLPDGSERSAALVGRAPGVDTAFLRVEGGGLKPLPKAAAVRPGAMVAVVGFTADVGASASVGIVGAVGGQRRTWRGGTLDQLLRLDVNLYPSQSGAAVIDTQGALVGLATPALLRHSAVAVPYATLLRLGEEVLREGRIRQGYLGIGLQPVPIPENMRARTGVVAESGLMVLNVEPGSPAETAGVQLGDILVALGEKTTADPDDLRDALRGDAVDKTVDASLIRAGERIQLPVTIRERNASGRKEA
jgi:serine protease DegQ